MNITEKLMQTDAIKNDLFVAMLDDKAYYLKCLKRVVFFSDSVKMYFCIGQNKMAWHADFDTAVNLHCEASV